MSPTDVVKLHEAPQNVLWLTRWRTEEIVFEDLCCCSTSPDGVHNMLDDKQRLRAERSKFIETKQYTYGAPHSESTSRAPCEASVAARA